MTKVQIVGEVEARQALTQTSQRLVSPLSILYLLVLRLMSALAIHPQPPFRLSLISPALLRLLSSWLSPPKAPYLTDSQKQAN